MTAEASEDLIYMTEAEYLATERYVERRREYTRGVVTAMAGAGVSHERVALALASDVHFHLRGKPCEAFKGDMRLKVLEEDGSSLYYYPDIMVVCDPKDDHATERQHPTVLIEVLSDDWKRDLHEKRMVYQTIASLQEYIVLHPLKKEAYVFRRRTGWKMETVSGNNGVFEIESIQLSVQLASLFGENTV